MTTVEITEVRIKLMEEPSERLQAFCSVTFDDAFVVRDLKIIEGNKGPFVAMPSRKLTDRCPRCNYKNHLRAQYCSQCGLRLGDDRAVKDEDGRAKLHADIAHPINAAAREMIQRRVLDAYEDEVSHAKQPGYISRYDEDYDYEDYLVVDEPAAPRSAQQVSYREVVNRVEHAEQETAQGPHHRTAEKQPEKQNSSAEPESTFGAGIL
jgi:stage V sporulation protein G